MSRFQATLERVSRVVNAPFVKKARAKQRSTQLDDGGESPPISPRRNVLTRCDTRCILMTTRELSQEFPDSQIGPRLIFDNPTIESIAQHLCDQDGQEQQPARWSPATEMKGWPRLGTETVRAFTQFVIPPEDDLQECKLVYETLYEAEGSSRCFRSTDGMECVILPKARVWIGANASDGEALPMEKPCHQITLSSFIMDIEPVSIGAYARFLNLTKPPLETLQHWILLHDIDERHCHLPLQCNEDNVWEAVPGVPLSWPMIMVSWYGANAYSLWANGRDWRNYRSAAHSFLPSEAQWEYAARGETPARFPWGNAPASPALVNVCFNMGAHDLNSHTSIPLEEFPIVPVNAELGMSPFGLRHMAGNVLNWCRDTYDPSFYSSASASFLDPCNYAEEGLKCERGGNWVEPAEVARSSYRRGRAVEGMGRCLGFRCIGLAADVQRNAEEQSTTASRSGSDYTI